MDKNSAFLYILTLVIFFVLQYILLSKSTNKYVRLIPLYGVIVIFIVTLLFYFGVIGETSGSFLPTNVFVALFVFGFVLASAIGTGLGWIVYSLINKKR